METTDEQKQSRSNWSARENFRRWLVDSCGGCDVQEATDGTGWPCGTCVIDLLNRMGLDSSKPEYSEKNEEPDRHNEVWRAILQIRDAEI